MKRIDFQALLRQEGIEYIERGKNVKRGEINIRCPFCGSADPSYHMGLSLDTGYWACWRNSNHRGKSPVRLLVKLLNMPYWRARELAGLSADYVDPDGFSTLASRLRSTGWSKETDPEREVEPLVMPREFRKITNSIATARYRDYLIDRRGFPERDVDELCYEYDLRCSPSGFWSHRLILPYYMDGALVTWTGRAIGTSELRYRDLSVAESLLPPKHTLYNHDALLEGGRWLIVVEGPIDALKLDFYGKPHGVRAVGLSTNSMTDDQLYLLDEAGEQFDHIGAMMDNAGATSIVDSMRMRQNLAVVSSSVKMLPVPGRAKDAGDATPTQILDFIEEHLS